MKNTTILSLWEADFYSLNALTEMHRSVLDLFQISTYNTMQFSVIITLGLEQKKELTEFF